MTPLSAHFSLEEMIFSSTATRLALANDPPPDVLENLMVAAAGMEKVRSWLGHPVHVDSGYRCAALNKAVNGAANSAHLRGYAVDFVCPDYGSPQQIVETLQASGLVFDQLICEGSWVHVSFDPQARQEVLTAHFGAGGAVYSKGV